MGGSPAPTTLGMGDPLSWLPLGMRSPYSSHPGDGDVPTLLTSGMVTLEKGGGDPLTMSPRHWGIPCPKLSTTAGQGPTGGWGPALCPAILPPAQPPRSLPVPVVLRAACPRPTHGREPCAARPGWPPRSWPR